jgi:hypothetical protein
MLGALATWIYMAVAALMRSEVPCLLVFVGLLLIGATTPLALGQSRARRAHKGWQGKNEEALALLRAGRYPEAADIWDTLAVSARWAPALHCLFLHNLSVAWLHLGAPDRALALMDRVSKSGWFRSAALSGVSVNLRIAHALAHAIQGDVDTAQRIRDEAVRALPEGRRGMTLLVDTMIGARRGTLGDEPTKETLRLAEASLMPTHVRAIPILYAFAKTTGDGGYRTGETEMPRAADGGLARGDLDFLAAEWPELAAYFSARGLSAPDAGG